MKYNHGEHCEGSICQDDNNLDWQIETLWCPGEKVCTKEPHMKFQKKQLAINKENKMVVIVSNEIGLGIVPADEKTRLFRDMLGRVNQKVASRADEVYFCVSGIPMRIK